jgi:F-type H+-transporting ATPase subunit alpha
MQSFAQFGSDLDEATQATIDHGERIRSVLVQSQYSPRPVTTQILTLFALKNGLTKTIKIEKMTEFMDGLVDNITAKHPEYIKEIEEKKVLSDALSSDLKTAMKAYVEQFERLQTAG